MLNFFALVLQNLRFMILKKSGVFIATLLSISFSICGIFFYSGYFLWNFYDKNTGSTADIFLDESNVDEIKSIIDHVENNYGDIQYVRALDENDTCVYGEYNRNHAEQLEAGKVFGLHDTSEEVVLASYLVEFGFVNDNETVLNKKLPVGNKDYDISGIIGIGEYDGYIIPVQTFINNFTTNKIEIGFTNVLSFKEQSSFKSFLNSSEVVDDYTFALFQNPFADRDFIASFVQILLIFIAIIINAFGMLYYWTVFFRRNYTIFKISGSTKSKNGRIIRIQSAFFLLMCLILGIIEYIILGAVIKNYDLVYLGSGFPYIIISIVIYIVLYIFASVVAHMIVRKEQIYRTTE